MEWSDSIQNWAGSLLDKWGSAQYVQPYEVQKLQLQALGQTGYYTEGQPGARVAASGINSSTLLLLGAAVVAVMLLKD